jgi:hypothetical protein
MEKINLFSEPKRFAELPNSVKMALLTLLASWLGHFLFLFFVFSTQLSQNMLIQHSGLALLSLFILAKLKNWARIICLTGNCIVLLFYLQILLLGITTAGLGMVVISLALLNLVLFGLTSFLLLTPEASVFFKQQSAKPRSTEAK